MTEVVLNCCVTFSATIVESPDVYWARVLSDVLVDPEAPSLVSFATSHQNCYQSIEQSHVS